MEMLTFMNEDALSEYSGQLHTILAALGASMLDALFTAPSGPFTVSCFWFKDGREAWLLLPPPLL